MPAQTSRWKSDEKQDTYMAAKPLLVTNKYREHLLVTNGERATSRWKHTADTMFTEWLKLTSLLWGQMDTGSLPPNGRHWGGHNISAAAFLLKTHDRSRTTRTQTNFSGRTFYKIAALYFSENIKVRKDKGWGNSARSEETRGMADECRVRPWIEFWPRKSTWP